MKIMFAPAHYMLDGVSGGSEFSWAYNIIRSLAAYPDIEIIAITGRIKAPEPFPPNVRIIAVDSSPVLRLTWAYRLGFVFKTFKAAKHVLRTERVDIVHHILPFGVHKTFNLLPILGLSRRIRFVVGPLQAPHTYVSDEEFIIYSQGQLTKYRGVADMIHDKIGLWGVTVSHRVLHFLSSKTLRRSDAMIVVNEETKDIYAPIAPTSIIRIISPGIQVDTFRRHDVVPSTTPHDFATVEIITVGSLIKRKGVDLIIKAIAELNVTHSQFRLRIVGDGPQRESLQTLAKDLGVEKDVTFDRYVPNVQLPSLYHAADVYVTMSFSESFGQTVVEAMAAGLCVIAAENIGTRGIIKNGRTGFLVRPGSVADLVLVLRRVCENRVLSDAIGAEAQRVAEERFDWSVIGAHYIGLYTQILSPQQRDF